MNSDFVLKTWRNEAFRACPPQVALLPVGWRLLEAGDVGAQLGMLPNREPQEYSRNIITMEYKDPGRSFPIIYLL